MYYLEVSDGPLTGGRARELRAFLAGQGLDLEPDLELTAAYYRADGSLAATGSLAGNVLKCIAVAPDCQGEGLSAGIVSALVSQAFARGRGHLFLFTKPDNRALFEPTGFYPVSRTGQVLLMENKKDGIRSFVQSLEGAGRGGRIGAIVANCNPFTLGHLFLIETAAAQCDTLHLFILSEDKSAFPADVRIQLARRATAHLPQVLVHPTSDYLISAATFPTYFIKEKAQAAQANCQLDLTIFCDWFAPILGIGTRFVGQEPLDPVTAAYNRQMKAELPSRGVQVAELPRRELDGQVISASRVRLLLREGRMEQVRPLVPDATWRFLHTDQGRDVVSRL